MAQDFDKMSLRELVQTVMMTAISSKETEIRDKVKEYQAKQDASGDSGDGGKTMSSPDTLQLQFSMNEYNLLVTTSSNLQKAAKDTDSQVIRNFN